MRKKLNNLDWKIGLELKFIAASKTKEQPLND